MKTFFSSGDLLSLKRIFRHIKTHLNSLNTIIFLFSKEDIFNENAAPYFSIFSFIVTIANVTLGRNHR